MVQFRKIWAPILDQHHYECCDSVWRRFTNQSDQVCQNLTRHQRFWCVVKMTSLTKKFNGVYIFQNFDIHGDSLHNPEDLL